MGYKWLLGFRLTGSRACVGITDRRTDGVCGRRQTVWHGSVSPARRSVDLAAGRSIDLVLSARRLRSLCGLLGPVAEWLPVCKPLFVVSPPTSPCSTIKHRLVSCSRALPSSPSFSGAFVMSGMIACQPRIDSCYLSAHRDMENRYYGPVVVKRAGGVWCG